MLEPSKPGGFEGKVFSGSVSHRATNVTARTRTCLRNLAAGHWPALASMDQACSSLRHFGSVLAFLSDNKVTASAKEGGDRGPQEGDRGPGGNG